MRFLSLDYDPVYGGDDVVRSSFTGDTSVFDFDVVIWDPARSFESYMGPYGQSHYQGLPSLHENVSVRLRADISRRRAEFAEFVNAGRTLIITMCPPQECYIDTGERQFSGTGRNRVTTHIVSKIDMLSAIPIKDLEVVRGRGNRITYVGDGSIVRLLRKYSQYVEYTAFMPASPVQAYAYVTETERAVGATQQSPNNGHLILLPRIDLKNHGLEFNDDDSESGSGETEPDEDASEWVDVAPDFQADLLAAVSQLTGEATISRPAWADQFLTDQQQKLRDEISAQQDAIEQSRARLAALQLTDQQLAGRDQLYLGSGPTLEAQVEELLTLLGGETTTPEGNRADLRVTFPEGNAVVEVKGVTKTAAEKHAAQLEKWVSDDHAENDVLPKGILAVNTWREIPLDERTGDDFPAQMLPYCTNRNHCLVTGLQLFVMRTQVEANPDHATEARRALLETTGVLAGYDDWRAVLKKNLPDGDA